MESVRQLMEPEQHETKQRPKWTRLLVWSTLGSTIGAAVPGGYCMGIINNSAVHMRSWCAATLLQKYGMQLTPARLDTLWASIVSIYLIGGVLGSACAGWAANRFGRRGCFLLSGSLLLLAALGFFSCRWLQSVELLLLCRLVVGLGAGLISTGLPMYHSEIAALTQRGTLGASCAVGFSVGILLAQICSMEALLGGEQHWHLALGFYVVFMAICYAPYRCYAESPKWLYIVKQQRQQALHMLVRLRGGNTGLQSEIQAMEQEAAGKCSSRSLSEVLKDSKMLLPVVLLCAYQGGQQLTGCSSIFYYSVSIFRSSGLSPRTAELLSLCAGNVNLATSLLNPWLMAKLYRRTLMLLSSFFCALLMFAFGLLVEYSAMLPWLIYGTIASIFLYLIAFQLALGAMPSFIGTELFEVPSRSVANSLGNQTGWSCNFLVGFLFPTMHSLMGSWVFLLFSLFSSLLFLLTKFYLPETRGREVAEVAELVSHGFRSKVL
ncbi:solute carrier family 2, facilitated glucose transporter member 1-like isoform X1 [Drosophila novamexicana]|uniref:solute carrier family 2, facilitated glucose transporter member 1-like isoform X1 n=1 Tax=Drosophila novamexicana TaxID=47314 RepID=UPI0011E588C5|nr:solute carrier family 2, facilitated glucose transporter member 1-like isoform X1 [Drosophila novamexicana]